MSEPQALIVDDNLKNVAVLARLLANEGLESIQVTNPLLLDDVSHLFGSLRVIFVDLEMPGRDGYEVLSSLKADPRLASVPVVAYTVHVSEMHEAHQRGFDGFLGKPLDPDLFPDQFTRILRGEPVWEKP